MGSREGKGPGIGDARIAFWHSLCSYPEALSGRLGLSQGQGEKCDVSYIPGDQKPHFPDLSCAHVLDMLPSPPGSPWLSKISEEHFFTCLHIDALGKPCENWAFMASITHHITASVPFSPTVICPTGFRCGVRTGHPGRGGGGQTPRERNESTGRKPFSRSCCLE